MTEKQIALARHALGLSDRNKVSYRNRFVAGPGHKEYADWMAMVSAGQAKMVDGKSISFCGDLFWLTAEGARLALKPGESLDPEDFPN